jgi:murein L,D-transpeptidase YcbB/YkuD
LTGDPEKGVPELQAEIAQGANKHISLDATLPVFVAYWTVNANEDGSVDFLRDVYGRDQRLLASLAGKRLIGRVTMNTVSECSKA